MTLLGCVRHVFVVCALHPFRALRLCGFSDPTICLSKSSHSCGRPVLPGDQTDEDP